MNFPNLINTACIPVTPTPPDTRCADPAFALLHPDICGSALTLRLKPGVGICCVLGSIQFQAFSVVNGMETLLTSGVVFSVSDNTVALIGANSGNLTGISGGTVTVTAKYQGISATAALTVLPGLNCCQTSPVATVLVVDKSKSMTLNFGSGYATKQAFADAVASAYAAQTNTQKDTIGLVTFNSQASVDEALTSNAATVSAAAAGVLSTQDITDLNTAIGTASEMLLASSAAFKVMVIISDGEDHPTNPADADPTITANAFKTAGGIIISVGVRSHGAGFNLLSVLATGGFFVNAYPSVVDEAIQAVYGLKGYVCGGQCVPPGNMYVNEGQLNYANFINWNVTQGHVDLFAPDLFDLLPGNGLYVSLVSNINPYKGELTGKTSFNFTAGKTYRLSFYLAGNQRQDLGTQNVTVKIGDGTQFAQVVAVPDYKQNFTLYSYNFTPQSNFSGAIIFTEMGNTLQGSYFGCLLDNIRLDNITDLITLFTDNFDSENLQFVPPACGVGVTGGGGGDDPDVVAFVAAAGLSDVTQINAVRLFVQTLKANNLWNSFDALYPFMGSSAGSHSINLKNPAKYQIAWHGSVTHGLNSVTGDGSTGYGDTGFNPSTAGGVYSQNSAAIGVYNRTVNPAFKPFIGTFDGSNSAELEKQSVGLNNELIVDGLNNGSIFGAVTVDFSGLLVGSRTGLNTQASYCSAGITANGNASAGVPNRSFYLLSLNNNGSALGFSNANLGFAFMGAGLSGVQFTILQNAVNALIALQGTAAQTGYSYYYGYNCYGYGCESSPPGSQLSDPNPLPDIEAGFVPPTVYTSTRSFTARCPNGTAEIGPTSSVPVMTSPTAPVGVVTDSAELVGSEGWRAFGTGPSWQTPPSPQVNPGFYLQYQFVTPIIAVAFAITPDSTMTGKLCQFRLQGSNDGISFTDVSGLYHSNFLSGGREQFSIPGGQQAQLAASFGPYLYYRLNISISLNGGSTFTGPAGIKLLEILEANPQGQGITETATVTSTISQLDADTKATAQAQAAATAALSQTGCATVYTSTQSYTAQCPVGSLGTTVTKSATATSYVSQHDADAQALTAAQAAATAALVCNGSNNTSQIYAFGNNGNVPALPRTCNSDSCPVIYPGVKFISGQAGLITRVRVLLKSYAANNPSLGQILLLSPAGKAVSLMFKAGGTTLVPLLSPVDLTFDSQSVTPVPAPPVTGSYQPTNVGDPNTQPYVTPAPQSGYLTSFSTLIGDLPNGSWSLWLLSAPPTPNQSSVVTAQLGFDLILDTA